MLLAYPEIHLRVDPAFGDPPLFDRPVVHGGCFWRKISHSIWAILFSSSTSNSFMSLSLAFYYEGNHEKALKAVIRPPKNRKSYNRKEC